MKVRRWVIVNARRIDDSEFSPTLFYFTRRSANWTAKIATLISNYPQFYVKVRRRKDTD